MVTKVFKSGNSQAVRIPKEFQISTDEVEILKRGDELVIRPIRTQNASIVFDLLAAIEGPITREPIQFQEREF
jgi:antitoxin VapB